MNISTNPYPRIFPQDLIFLFFSIRDPAEAEVTGKHHVLLMSVLTRSSHKSGVVMY